MILTVSARNRPAWPAARRATSSPNWSSPRSRSHHSAPATRAVSRPDAANSRYVLSVSLWPRYGPMIASCHPVIPSECRWRWPSASPATYSAGLVAGGRAVAHPLEPPIGGVGRVRAHPRKLERPAVDPGAVVVAVNEVDGPVWDDMVQVAARGSAGGEMVHRPAAAEDPRSAGVPPRILGDPGEAVR